MFAYIVQESLLEQRKLLVESFGSKKKKTEVRTKEANRVEADDKLQESLTVAVGKSLFTLAETARREDLPEYDDKTDVPSKCYDVKSLLTPEGWGIATQQAQPLLANAGAVSSWVAATWQALSTWTEVLIRQFCASKETNRLISGGGGGGRSSWPMLSI